MKVLPEVVQLPRAKAWIPWSCEAHVGRTLLCAPSHDGTCPVGHTCDLALSFPTRVFRGPKGHGSVVSVSVVLGAVLCVWSQCAEGMPMSRRCSDFGPKQLL